LVVYERGSIAVTSNRGFEQWGEILGDAMVAAALIDRLVHHATMITLKGKSYRLRERGTASRPPLRLRRYATPPDRRTTASKPDQWCTFQRLKLVHFSVPLDTVRLPRRPTYRVVVLPPDQRTRR
jgi:IstB-like ATP binding protein